MEVLQGQNKYVVAVIFSEMTLSRICEFIEDYMNGEKKDIGLIRIDRSKGKETNRTIILMNRELYNYGVSMGLNKKQPSLDFVLSEYELREFNFPKENQTQNLFLRNIPYELTSYEVISQLQNKIDVMVKFGLIEEGKIRIKIPLESRETGKHRRIGYIYFGNDVTKEQAALVKLLLHDNKYYLSDNKNSLIKCYWANKKSDKKFKGKKQFRPSIPNKTVVTK